MPVRNQRHDRHLEHLAQLPDGIGQHSRCPAKRIARFRVDHQYVSVFDDLLEIADQNDVVRKLALADAADFSEQALAPDKAVDGNDEI